jgi:hypothetical protein
LIGVLGVFVYFEADCRKREPPIALTIGRLVCLEVKRPGVKVKPLAALEALRSSGKDLNKRDLHDYEQQLWMKRVRAKGGFACYVRSVEDARAAIARARKSERE